MLRRKTNAEKYASLRKVEWLTTPLEYFCEKVGEAVAISIGVIFSIVLIPVYLYSRFTWRKKDEATKENS